MGYPAKNRQPAASAPSAQARLPCMKCLPGARRACSILSGIFHRYRKVGAEQLAKSAARTIFHPLGPEDGVASLRDRSVLDKHLLPADVDAQPASLAPIVPQGDS